VIDGNRESLRATLESQELLAYAGGDQGRLDSAVRRRLTGEPLAWITGRVTFCGIEIHVDPDVYVPRWLTEPLTRRAVERLPEQGIAIDLCTGSGAIAAVLRARRPKTRVVVGVVPYVPTPELVLLQRDTFTFERLLSYDGGPDGADILRRVLVDARRFLKRGGALLLEVGGDQADLLQGDLLRLGYVDVNILADEDGDVRGIEATLG
jgi:release factor glutamine methyltransferase